MLSWSGGDGKENQVINQHNFWLMHGQVQSWPNCLKQKRMEHTVLTMTRNGTQGFSDRNNHFIKASEVPKSIWYHHKATWVLKCVCKDGAGCDNTKLHIHPSDLVSGQDLT